MNNIYTLVGVFLVSLTFVQCSKDPYFIEGNRVGLISNEDIVENIEDIYKHDSIVKNLSEGDLGGRDTQYVRENDEYLIYSKEGKHLITIVPKTQHDSTSTVKYVEILDPKYKTEKGLGLNSLFKDINVNYTVNKIEPSLSSVILYIDEINATVALDKRDLGMQKFSIGEITINQIPDMAKVKYLTIWFDYN